MLNLHYNGSSRFVFVNAAKIYQFKAKDSEINDYVLYSGNISKDFTMNNMKKSGFREVVKFSSLDFNPIGTNDILDKYS